MEKFGFYQQTQMSLSDIIMQLANIINKRSNIKIRDAETQTQVEQQEIGIGDDVAVGENVGDRIDKINEQLEELINKGKEA